MHVVCTGLNTGEGASEDGTISIISTHTLEIIGRIAIGGSPSTWTLDQSSNTIYLGGIGKIMAYQYNTQQVLHSHENPLFASEQNENLLSGISHYEQALFISNFAIDRTYVLNKLTGQMTDQWISGDGPVSLFHYSLTDL